MSTSSKPVMRFAPSPTGKIHIGNARTALFNWLHAKKHDGHFILRYDDTDAARSKQEFADQILVDLNWMGIEPDQIERQSARFESYDAAAEKLKKEGLLYPCYETADELDRKRKRQLARGLPPVYSRDALRLSAEEIEKLEGEGRKPHWRFKLPNYATGDVFAFQKTVVEWDDIVRGHQTIDLASMSDPVLIREDGSYLYTLPSCVDDLEMGVSVIIRGDDHVTNSAAQISLFEALGGKAPQFGHHNLLTDASGEGLSKRLGSLSIESLSADGFEPMAVASLATMIGTSDAVAPMANMQALLEVFAASKSTKSAAKFSMDELKAINAKLVHELSFEDVAERLGEKGVSGAQAEAFWLAVRGNVELVGEAVQWWSLIEGTPQRIVEDEDAQFIAQAGEYLPEGDIDGDTWKAWTSNLKQETGRKGRGLFMPLRKALTGMEHGPELAPLLPLIGRERILARLAG